MTVRIGIVGCGRIADAHAAAIGARENAVLVAAADPDPEARRRAGEKWGCAGYDGVDRMLDAQEVDVALVCAPPALHRPLTERLLEAGVHVLCEKPMATTSADARAMLERATVRRRVLMISSKFRFVGDLLQARRAIEEGAIGMPVSCEITFCARFPIAGWALRPEASGGGVVMDNGPHVFDVVASVLAARPAVVSAAFGPRTADPAVEDTAEILFRTDRGTVGRAALSWTYFTKDTDYLIVQGTKGTLRVGWSGAGIRSHGGEWEPFGSGYDKARAFRDQLGAFLTLVDSGDGRDSAVEGVLAMEFVEKIYEAERRGSDRPPSSRPGPEPEVPAGTTPR